MESLIININFLVYFFLNAIRYIFKENNNFYVFQAVNSFICWAETFFSLYSYVVCSQGRIISYVFLLFKQIKLL